MSTQEIHAENLGPITDLTFKLESHGVTVLKAPNGSGKSILLESVQAAARGKGKLPLRDRTKRGKVEAFGAKVTIGGTCRHTGEFEVANLEGRFDLASLVDPGLKTVAAADAQRIKALISLTDVKADPGLFKAHEAFKDFDEVVVLDSLETDDLCEMARRVKADYDDKARAKEKEGDTFDGKAAGLDPSSEIDLTQEDNEEVLRLRYDDARDNKTRMDERVSSYLRTCDIRVNAEKELAELKQPENSVEELEANRAHISAAYDSEEQEIVKLQVQIEDLRKQLESSYAEQEKRKSAVTLINSQINEAKTYESTKAALQRTIDSTKGVENPSEEDLADAKRKLEEAARAMEAGALVRKAKEDQSRAAQNRTAAKIARSTAQRYRDAGRSTDEVLSAAIQCASLRVESDGASARLVTDTDRGKGIPYHDLSQGERWKIAIDLGADQVGEDGLLVIPQEAWESLDGHNRVLVHEHAKARKVYILTAEASEDPDAAKEIVPTMVA